MILRLGLTNWRAYDSLDLELGPGTTFIVASNGIGKTSLVMAAAWGIFGDASQVNPVEERRLDSERASVEVVLRLPQAGNVTIQRSIDGRGKTALNATLDHRTITTEPELRELLVEELGAELSVLTRLTFMTHGGSLQSEEGEFNLQSHLASLFGVDPLLEAAQLAEGYESQAASAIRRFKAARRTEGRNRESLASEAAASEEAIAAARVQREEATATLDQAEERLRNANDWARYRVALEARDLAAEALAAQARSMFAIVEDASSIRDALVRREEALQSALVASERRLAGAQAEIQVATRALSEIGESKAICPTCLRPLSEHETDQAVQLHEARRSELIEMATETEEAIRSQRSEVGEMREMLTEFSAIPTPLRPSDEEGPADVDMIGAECEQARAKVREIDQLIAAESAKGSSATDALGELAEDERRTRELSLLLRQEAIARAASAAWTSAADAITARRIDPLAAEIGRRWKQVFGTGGVQLSPRGEITRVVGNRRLPFRSFSGGEKVWALLLTRLLVTAASTRAPFVWLDEPLEHLDPRLRTLLAGTIARATDMGGIRQIVVTTYESEVARQLMEDVKSASLLYVRAAD